MYYFVLSMQCRVKKAKVDGLCAGIADISDALPTFETFDIKGTSGEDRRKLDLRLKFEGGKPKAVQVKLNETKVIVFDLLCLHRLGTFVHSTVYNR